MSRRRTPSLELRCVLFDWDSTLSSIEGIDELATELPAEQRARVEAATQRAMAGECSLDEVYQSRLDAVAPSAGRLRALGEQYYATLLPDAALVIEALRFLGKQVGVVSGGLRDAILVATTRLGIEAQWVHAVEIRLDDDGHYRGFDEQAPLTRSGGKRQIVERIDERWRPLAFVGDGITDLELQDDVDRFIGFGGVARRPAVERGARIYRTEPRLAPLLQDLLTPPERERLRTERRFTPLSIES